MILRKEKYTGEKFLGILLFTIIVVAPCYWLLPNQDMETRHLTFFLKFGVIAFAIGLMNALMFTIAPRKLALIITLGFFLEILGKVLYEYWSDSFTYPLYDWEFLLPFWVLPTSFLGALAGHLLRNR